MRRGAKGFTLVELLIVIGIIAVLISLLMPVVTRAREHSHLVGCMSNQKQIYTAIKEFAQNNDSYTQSVIPAGSGTSPNPALGKGDICPGSSGQLLLGQMPDVTGGSPKTANGVGQAMSTSESVSQESVEQCQRSALIIRRYLPNSSVFHCPERDLHPSCWNGRLWTPTMYHYVFNVHFLGTLIADRDGLPQYSTAGTFVTRYPNSPQNLWPVTLTRARNASQCVLITEDGRGNDGGQRDYAWEQPLGRLEASPVHSRRTTKTNDALPFTYADYAVCTFVDGHTEAVLVNTMLGDPNSFTVPTDCTGLR
jgi:prepilin-type N-terminal cleavage/methylation domain-containing protein